MRAGISWELSPGAEAWWGGRATRGNRSPGPPSLAACVLRKARGEVRTEVSGDEAEDMAGLSGKGGSSSRTRKLVKGWRPHCSWAW